MHIEQWEAEQAKAYSELDFARLKDERAEREQVETAEMRLRWWAEFVRRAQRIGEGA